MATSDSILIPYDRMARITQLQLNMGVTEFKICDVNLNTLLEFFLSKNLNFNVERKSNGLCIVNITL
jgi:hypothetical protein